MKIGILGISANPPHLGHERLIVSLMRSKKFDKLILYLTGNRKDKQYVHPDHRVAMTELAFGKFRLRPNFKTEFVIRYSDAYSENTPTIILLRKLQEEFPDDQLVFIIGSDLMYPQKDKNNKGEIETDWIEGEKLIKEYDFLIFPREDYPVFGIPEHFEYIPEIIPNISSTKIRNYIKHKSQEAYIEDNISEDVAAYIYKYKLYQ